MGTSARLPRSTARPLGGMTAATSPEEAMTPRLSLRSYPCFSISGYRVEPSSAVSAVPAPLSAASPVPAPRQT